MKQILLICILVSFIFLCYANDVQQPLVTHTKNIALPIKNIQSPQPSRTTYEFMIPPTSLLISYWDYMIGGYYSTGVRVQKPNTGNDVILTYMGQRTSTGQRRVFAARIDQEGTVLNNNEISYSNLREGYVSQDIDQESGIPIFAWHGDFDPTDTQLEVRALIDPFPNGIPPIDDPSFTVIDNPISLLINGTNYTDNEFIWPEVHIGPSPLPDHRRAYIFANNSVSHTNNPSENVYYVYADFTTTQLEHGDVLNWSHASIPILDQWNTDQAAWRRFFHSTVIGDDGNVYLIGYHFAFHEDLDPINEPYVDVLMNTNFGEGEWVQYSVNPNFNVICPVFDPPVELTYSVYSGTHNSAYITADGHLHNPLIFGFSTPDETTRIPMMDYIKDVDFNVNDHTFLIHDLYPTGVHPNDGNPVLPWDINEDGIADPSVFTEWPYMYWDEESPVGMIFSFNMVKFTKMNDQGMVAAVWSSSLNAKLYNESPDVYPELAPYANVPEIFISVYPVPGEDGPQWSIPIALNSINTPELNILPNDPMIPEWVYPGDYIEYLGNTAEGDKVGKLHLMFFDDNEWGSDTPWESGTGTVMYAALEIAWNGGEPQVGDIVVNNSDETNSTPVSTLSNYPNPFNPTTTISYNVMKQGQTSLSIYNVKGQKVRSLMNELKQTGEYKVVWDGTSDSGSKVGSGVYFYRLENNSQSLTKKMVMLK